MEFNVTDEEDEVGQALNDVHSTPIGNKNCPKSLGPVYYAKKYWLIFGIISHVFGQTNIYKLYSRMKDMIEFWYSYARFQKSDMTKVNF